jgi:hypothetical protein
MVAGGKPFLGESGEVSEIDGAAAVDIRIWRLNYQLASYITCCIVGVFDTRSFIINLTGKSIELIIFVS